MSYRFDPMECIACSRRFRTNVRERIPVIGSCGHHLCKKCVDTKVDNLFYCRECEKDTTTAQCVNGRWRVNCFDELTIEILENKMYLPECSICEQPMSSTGEKIPKTITCGHTYCRKCLLNRRKEHPNSEICPECDEATYTYEPDHFPTNSFIQKHLAQLESSYPRCEDHPDHSKVLVCLDCDSQHFCEICINDEHRHHEHRNSMVESAELRKLIGQDCQKRDVLSRNYKNDSDKFLDISDTFKENHPDFANLSGDIKAYHYHHDSRGSRKEDQEFDALRKFCREKKDELECERQARLTICLVLGNTTDSELWKRSSDYELVSNRESIKSWLENSPTQTPEASPVFEEERLANYSISRIPTRHGSFQILFKKPFIVLVHVNSVNADEVYARFFNWLMSFRNSHIAVPQCKGGSPTFVFQNNKFKIIKLQSTRFEQNGPCYFSENNTSSEIRTVPVNFRAEHLQVNGTTEFRNVTEGFVWLLKLLKSGLPLHD